MEFLDSLLDRSWLIWIAAALVLGVLEITAIDLVFAMLAGGALAGALADALGLGFVGQVLVSAAVAGLLIATIRPVLLRRLKMPPSGTTNAPALVGRPALVLSDVTVRGGLVKLVGETWSARTTTAGQTFAAGDDVVVTAIDGATAVVGPLHPGPAPGAPHATEGES
ncbi:NfeD family protein [Kineococcus rubinsiae]|uniref:NfeD family protein n=1 Tax=Kineococcus rubinsiae TaxID=2609562 RepID=UPI00142F7C1C|nr:NfeD family protein [Kineococcus rubinsiae]NIZ93066.1 NfeD family protein [Kineococcus rubinsiae]